MSVATAVSTAIDPAAWLASFEAVGGWYVATSDGSLCVGWTVFGRSDAEQDEARSLCRELDHSRPAKSAVSAHIAALEDARVLS